VVYDWLCERRVPCGIPPVKVEGFRNRDGQVNTIRVDCKVVHETDTGHAKSDESAWMRFTLDTIAKTTWPSDSQAGALPRGLRGTVAQAEPPLASSGRDVRCIVSVGMLTEGWDCNTVTHIIGLRPFMSQLLCEQVVGRGLRRRSYDIGPDGLLSEEVAQVLGVPFEVIPFKATKADAPNPKPSASRLRPPSKIEYAITFPRVEGYYYAGQQRYSQVIGGSVLNTGVLEVTHDVAGQLEQLQQECVDAVGQFIVVVGQTGPVGRYLEVIVEVLVWVQLWGPSRQQKHGDPVFVLLDPVPHLLAVVGAESVR